MKKLMTMLAAVATAFGLYAADPVNYGTSFEGLTAGSSIFDAETEGANWEPSADPNATALVADYVSGEGKVTGEARPAFFIGETQNQYLNVKTALGSPIARKLDTAWDLATGNFYSDTLVKFTNFDSAPESIDGKIAVWVQEIENDNGTITTNLMVTAGSDATGTRKDYLVQSNWEPSADQGGWTRVTIKAIPSILSKGTMPGFAIWVDQVQLFSTDSKADIDALNLSLTDIAKSYNKEGNLFLSMDQGTAAISTIRAVAFDGQGQIDDVLLTDVAPAFAGDPMFFTIDADDNVESIQINGGTPIAKADLPTTVVWNGVDSFTVYANYADGYIDGDWTLDGESVTPGSFAPVKDGQIGVVNAKAALVKIGNNYYGSLAEALADTDALAAADGEVTLQGALTIDEGQEVTTEYEDMITIDLSGETITYEGTGTAITAAKLTVLDSTTEGTTADSGAIVAADGSAIEATEELVIKNGKINGWITYEAGEAGSTGGWFTSDPTDFGIVADGYKANPIEQDLYIYEIVKSNPGTVIFVCSATGYESDPVTAVDQMVNKPEDDVIDFQKVYTVKNSTWYKDDQFIEVFDFDTDTIEDDDQITLYAQAGIVLAQDDQGNYLIAKAADLVKLEKLMTAAAAAGSNYSEGKTFLQTANIDMTDYKDANGAQVVWKGIAAQERYDKEGIKTSKDVFVGTYDGDNKTISNLLFPDGGKYRGLFNSVRGGTIKNLTVNNISLPTTVTEAGYSIVGSVIGTSTLENLTATGTIYAESNVGGIVGAVNGATLVKGCVNKATIDNASVFHENNTIGGICGYAGAGVVFEDCVNEGAIIVRQSMTSADNRAGGIVGSTLSSSITFKNCVSKGTFTGPASVADGEYPVIYGSMVGKVQYKGIVIQGVNVAPAADPVVGSTTTADVGELAYAQAGQTTGTIEIKPLVKENTYDVLVNVPSTATAFTLAEENDWIAFKPATGVTFAGTVAVADTETLEVKPEAIEGGTKFTAVKKAVGPTPDPEDDDCDVTKNDDGSYTVTPKNGSTTATVKGVKVTDTLKITSAADFVLTTDAEPAAIVMELNGSVVPATYFKGGDATVGFDTALSDAAKATLVEETEDDKPLVIGENVDVTINTVAGLKYQLVRGAEVGEIKTALGEPVVGDGKPLKLTDDDKPEGKAFYVIKTSK